MTLRHGICSCISRIRRATLAPDARGIFCGITGGVTKAHLARAVLEGVAMQIVDILNAMSQDSHVDLQSLKVDGGMSKKRC